MEDGHAGVEIAQAARRMGISKDAVRRRIQRGTLAAFKGDDGHWLVIVPTTTIADDAAEMRGERRDTTDATRDYDGFAAVIATFQEQLHVKDQQLAEKDRQISELHVLLQTSQQNEQRLLSATISDTPYAPERPGDDESRVRAPNVAPEGTGRAEEASEKPHRSWWQRWFSPD